jgi:hypothetical protein
MARDSRRVRKVRRLKREAKLATKYMEVALAQRDMFRQALLYELNSKKRPDLLTKPEVTIEKVEETNERTEDNPTDSTD